MAQRNSLTVRSEQFEGPLDLLLYLIRTHELDISTLSISKITDSYLRYVRMMQELDFEFASEFLLMAATLLLWKSRSILPQEGEEKTEEEEEDGPNPEDLVIQLLEHRRFLEAGEDLNQLTFLGEDVFVRPNKRIKAHKVWKDMDITTLATSYQDMLVRQRRRTKVLRKETVSIAEKIQAMGEKLKLGEWTDMATLMSETPDRPETVATFLASLELSRLKHLRVHQEDNFLPIFLELIKSLQDLDIRLANGFDAENKVNEALSETPAEGAPSSDAPPLEKEAEANV